MVRTPWRRILGLLGAPSARPAPRRRRLSVEALEPRTLLSHGVDDGTVLASPATDPTAPSATVAVAATPTVDTTTAPAGTAADDPGTVSGQGGTGVNPGTPDPPTDAQRGYPLPPGTGPAPGSPVGVSPTPMPVLPTSPGGTDGPASPPAPTSTGAAASAPVSPPSGSSASVTSTAAPAAAPAPGTAARQNNVALRSHVTAHGKVTHVTRHPAHHGHGARKAT